MKYEFFSIRRVGVLAFFILHTSYFILAPSASAQFLVPVREQHSGAACNPLVASYVLTSARTLPRDSVPMSFTSDHSAAPHKSVLLAATLSAILPGLGEYYVGDNIGRGMIFTGVEVGLWIGMIHWQQEYNSAQNAFYSFSSSHFSKGRYALHLDSLLLSDTQWVRQLYPTNRADSSNIASINRAEATLDSLKQIFPDLPDSDYTHRLVDPNVDFQQYNEMISKYWQYISGWDKVGNWSAASFMRADAQHQADIANDFLFGIILNHALSALDAALLARDHNSAIRLHGDLVPAALPDGSMAYIPTMYVQYRF
jgi:hypothetical protein